MALPRNDSSVFSSLQMDYGDSDDEEMDSKNNSFTNATESETDSTALVKTEPVEANESNLPKDDDNVEVKVEDIKSESVKSEPVEVSPVDFISDDEEDSQKEDHHHHHHHHRHKGHHHIKEEEQKLNEIVSDSLNTDSPASQGSIKINKKATSLVSYGPDEDVGTDDEDSAGEDTVDDPASPELNPVDASILSRSVQNMSKDDIKIPLEPSTKCPYPLQRKIDLEYERMMRDGVDHNRMMQERKSFRNPSIYEKLIDYCHIDENGTNFPPEIYNPHVWGKESFYDELDKSQRKDMERREKEKKDRTKIEFLTGTKKPACQIDPQGGPDEKKRKTKWDAQPGNIQVQYAKLPSAQQNPGVVNLTAAATGTKGKVISAVGSLSSKKAAK